MDDQERMKILSETEWFVINGESNEAIKLLDSVLKNNKNDTEVIFRKALVYYIDLNLIDALKELDNVLKIDSSNIDALLLKGEILAGFHKNDEAIETFNQIHPKILPYCYKILIDYLIEFEQYGSCYYNVFEFDSYWEYIYVELNIFRKFNERFLDYLKDEAFEKGLIWQRIDSNLEISFSSMEYFSYEPIKQSKNIISGVRLSDEEPDNEKINVEDIENCIVCGKKLTGNQKKLCRSCYKKQYASRIIKKLVSVINPGVVFKKGDLKVLNLDNTQIQDYIWTLQEFDLIDVDNDKFMLKDKDVLNKFRIDSKMEPIDFDSIDEENKLVKTCKICGESLPISQFYKSSEGHEDYCKICKKLIVTAKYLEDIIDYVGFDNEFDETDLNEHIPNQNQIMGMIWSLQDNDLLIKNENQLYILTDKSKCLNFLGKYDPDYEYAEKNIKFKSKSKSKFKPKSQYAGGLDKSSILPKSDVSDSRKNKSLSDKQKQMDIILKARNDGKTREEAAKLAGIPLYKINHWYKEGSQGFGEDNVSFYNELKKIEENLLNCANSNERKQMDFVLKLLRQGKSKAEVAELTEMDMSTLTIWYNQGKNNANEHSRYFYIEVNNIKDLNKKANLYVDSGVDFETSGVEDLDVSADNGGANEALKTNETDDNKKNGGILSRLRKLYEES